MELGRAHKGENAAGTGKRQERRKGEASEGGAPGRPDRGKRLAQSQIHCQTLSRRYNKR